MKKRVRTILLAAAMLISAVLPAGCMSKEAKIELELQYKTEEFIAEFASGDINKMEDLVDGRFDYSISIATKKDIMLKLASKTEVDKYENFEVDTKAGKAKLRTKISYIDIFEFGRDKNNRGISIEECMANVDTYEKRETANFTFNFVRGDDGSWKVKDTTAERYEDLFNHQYLLSVMALSKDKAKEACLDVFSRIARGEFNQQMFVFDIEDVGAMNTWNRDVADIKDAMTEFSKAYFTFFVEHGLTIEETSNAYEYKITGYVPSKEGLMSYYASDEYAIESNMAAIRAENAANDNKRQAVWDSFIAGIYYDMAKMIPDLMGEEYSITLKVVNDGNEVKIKAKSALCSITTDDIFAAPKYDYNQDKAARKKAIQALFDAGELTRAQYDKYMSEFREDGKDNAPQQTTVVDASNGVIYWQGVDGYPNQAVNVKEEAPSWSDGNLIYGTSTRDQAGISMHYSKEPGWLNTAGYNVSTAGTAIMLKYDKKLTKGTKLVFDWTINGKDYQTNVVYTVTDTQAESGVFIFALASEMKAGDVVEFRLWEEGHNHVIAYVKLTKT